MEKTEITESEKRVNEGEGFRYTYSAREQAELRRIREKYTTPTEEEDKMARLRRLDRAVTEKAQTVALTFGILGALILGFGMSIIMTELGAMLSLDRISAPVIGIVTGLFGGTLASLAFPVYSFVLKKEREKVAPEILRLTEELLK